MADFPENEKQEREAEEFSTVFSDPAAHREIKVKKKKVLPKIIASVLALCLLIGATVAVINLIPVLKDEENSSSLSDGSIEVMALKSDDISSVKVENSIGVTEFYSETDSSEDTETTTWKIKGLDGDVTSSSNIETVVGYVGELTAKMTVTQKTAEECGLNDPAVRVEVSPKEKESYTLILGGKSPDNMGYYLKIEGKDDIYLVGDSIYEALNFQLLDFANTDNISGFVNVDGELDDYYSSGALANFDRLTFKGGKFGSNFEIIANTDSVISEYYGYVVKNPTRLADNYSAVLTMYQDGIMVDGAYSFDATAGSLEKYGLNDPDLETTMYIKDKSITYKFALQEDGDYAVVGSDSKLIHKVSPLNLAGVVDTKPEDYYSKVVFITSIDNLDKFNITAKGKEYNFTVTVKETEDEDGETEKSYNITLNGKKVKTENFKDFYEECVSLEYKEFNVTETSETPSLVFDITLKDGTKTKIEFTSVSATRYNCKIDGVALGKVTATSVNNIIKSLENF